MPSMVFSSKFQDKYFEGVIIVPVILSFLNKCNSNFTFSGSTLYIHRHTCTILEHIH